MRYNKTYRAFHTWICSIAFLQGEALQSFVPNDTNGRKFPIFIAVVVAFIEIQLELGVLTRVDVQLNGFISGLIDKLYLWAYWQDRACAPKKREFLDGGIPQEGLAALVVLA